MIDEQELTEMRDFADRMGSEISVYSLQYQLAHMVWTLVDAYRKLRDESKAKEQEIPLADIKNIIGSSAHLDLPHGIERSVEVVSAWTCKL